MVLREFPKETGLDATTITIFFEKHTDSDPYEADQFYKFTRVITQLKYVEKREKQLFLVEAPHHVFFTSNIKNEPQSHKAMLENCPREITGHLPYYFNDADIIVENIDNRKVSKLIISLLCKTDEEIDKTFKNSKQCYVVFPDNEIIKLEDLTFEHLIIEYNCMRADSNQFHDTLNNSLLRKIFINTIKNCDHNFEFIKDRVSNLNIVSNRSLSSFIKDINLKNKQELAALILKTFNNLMELNILKKILENKDLKNISLISGFLHSNSILTALSSLGCITKFITNQEITFLYNKNIQFWPVLNLSQFDELLTGKAKTVNKSCVLI